MACWLDLRGRASRYWLGNPTSGSDWYDKLTTDLVLQMPQIVNLTPWWQAPSGTWYFLTDWKNHRSAGGHYIVANGTRGAWDGSRTPGVRFDDGAGKFVTGTTGTFWDVQYDMYQLIKHHHNIVIW